ncbi:MAG: hypothetical protein IT303_17680 [Dehalococcoidia bacterium]|nr:hypothetical protein [Dehalococcoidia bacterium]
MTRRYVGAVGLFLGVVCLAGLTLGAMLPVVESWQLVLAALVLYPAGVYFDLLPPGRPPGVVTAAAEAPDEPGEPEGLPPAMVPGPPRSPGFAGWSYVDMDGEAEPPQRGTLAFLVVAALAVGLAVGAVATGLAMSMREEGATEAAVPGTEPPAEATGEQSAVSPSPTPSPTTEATATPTATATPSPTPSPTPEPPTPTPTVARRTEPTPAPPTPVPTLAPQTSRSTAASIGGTWEIVDTVTYGPGQGETYRFEVDLRQAGGVVTGGGAGLDLVGERQGDRIVVAFEREGATGYFIWWVADGETLWGEFRDNGAENGGTSLARRVD